MSNRSQSLPVKSDIYFHPDVSKISSRALHVPWDEAGCLCPVGDFFNYAAPGAEPSPEDADDEASTAQLSSSCRFEGAAWNSEAGLQQRLTDGGYEEDEAAYCFYARKRYKKGEQVSTIFYWFE